MTYDQWKAQVVLRAARAGLSYLLGGSVCDESLRAMHGDGMTPREAIQSLYEDAGCPIEKGQDHE